MPTQTSEETAWKLISDDHVGKLLGMQIPTGVLLALETDDEVRCMTFVSGLRIAESGKFGRLAEDVGPQGVFERHGHRI